MNYYYHNMGRIPNIPEPQKKNFDSSRYPVGMCYVPWQTFQPVYPLDKAFCAGTLFPSLDKPFLGKAGCAK